MSVYTCDKNISAGTPSSSTITKAKWQDLIKQIRFLEVENKKLREKVYSLENQVRIDSLTKVETREYGMTYLEMSLKNNLLDSLGLVFIDVDHLKIINDTEGHIVGDEVLAYVGSALTRFKKPSESISRFGGDEFLAVLPNATHQEINIWCKQLHETLAKQRLPLARPSLSITVTTGSYVYNMKGDEKLTSKQLLSLVDLDMYQKKGGRHR
ncbi:GGDEF domain-containing protein [Vibrio parahaemolyticus]|uniref:GGDEF domain-containing protein n=1 Tax=Vibrio harveyi group TaxID=717610 RepID=UPI00111CCA51|nr:GGDEF domain-containing protein [Vibrio parahaemolyticus]EIU6866041.1 GGDEF domain-containing protein [Vibrio parahaemolyticus]EJG0716514.1 GGDEF domain-containing protein [Vibrio parahaemolyticus]EKB1969028.1 GGDEF domain-containing protein [Vibrio parahaemolyticus]TOI73808.1 GGDEF domain-containing protein [Vibrio parahaemolyticus]